jgi:hypothetical protein
MKRSLLLLMLSLSTAACSAEPAEPDPDAAPAESAEGQSQPASTEIEQTTSTETTEPRSGLSAAEVLALGDNDEVEGRSSPIEDALGENPVLQQPDYESSQQNPYNVTPDSQGVAAGYGATAMGGRTRTCGRPSRLAGRTASNPTP